MTKLLTLLALLLAIAAPARADETPIRLGYAKCAHCMPLSLAPKYGGDVKIEAIAFNTGRWAERTISPAPMHPTPSDHTPRAFGPTLLPPIFSLSISQFRPLSFVFWWQ